MEWLCDSFYLQCSMEVSGVGRETPKMAWLWVLCIHVISLTCWSCNFALCTHIQKSRLSLSFWPTSIRSSSSVLQFHLPTEPEQTLQLLSAMPAGIFSPSLLLSSTSCVSQGAVVFCVKLGSVNPEWSWCLPASCFDDGSAQIYLYYGKPPKGNNLAESQVLPALQSYLDRQ